MGHPDRNPSQGTNEQTEYICHLSRNVREEFTPYSELFERLGIEVGQSVRITTTGGPPGKEGVLWVQLLTRTENGFTPKNLAP